MSRDLLPRWSPSPSVENAPSSVRLRQPEAILATSVRKDMNGEKVAHFFRPAGTYEYVDAGFASERMRLPSVIAYPDGLPARLRLSRAAT